MRELSLTNVDVDIKFNSKAEKDSKVSAFLKDYDNIVNAYANGEELEGWEIGFIEGLKIRDIDDTTVKLEGCIDCEESINIDVIFALIKEHFKNANGEIITADYSCGTMGAGIWIIKNGNCVVSNSYELRNDIRTLISYIKDLVGSNIDTCGVKHIIDKYDREDK